MKKLWGGRDENGDDGGDKPVASLALRTLPTPALKWLGPAGRIALRAFDWSADAGPVCDFQEEIFSTNFEDFHYSESFAAAFRHDLRRAALDPQHGLFVLDEGELAGFLWVVICQNGWTGERYGYINNIYVTPQRRGHGLAEELMRQAENFFAARHVRRLRLTVTTSNAAAMALYRHCGFRTTRHEMEKDL